VANSFDSNTSRKVMRQFLEAFDAARNISKSVNTQLFQGKFTPASGSTVDVKRPHDYTTYRDAQGDLTSYTKPDIVSGKATATVQDYFTSAVEWENLSEAIEMDQLDEILAPMATRICQDLETDFAKYMTQNCGGSYAASGTYGTAVTTWADVAAGSAYLESLGVPMDKKWHYAMNPFTATTLAGASADSGGQINRASGSDSLVDSAYANATIANNFAGFRVIRSTHLHGFTSATTGDLVGAINGTPNVTYAAAKDSMTQTFFVDAFGTFAGGADSLKGQVVEITAGSGALNMLSHATRNPIVDSAGANVVYKAVIVSNTAFAAGAGAITISGPAIYEATGAYNTVSQALADNDVVTILGADTTFYQPNLMYHPDSFSIATVKLPKLYSTDTVAVTKDGMSIRCSKYADGDKNEQRVRFDLLPAYATLNPWFAAQAWG
jgi:hypothetical protein